MKLLFLFLFIGIQTGYASQTYAQQTLLSLKVNKQTLKNVFREIEKQSEYIFFYYDGVLDANHRVSLNAKNQTVDKILDHVFEGTDNTYVISDRQIFIARKDMAVSETNAASLNVQQQRKVTGKVTDQEGQPLPGVSVIIKGTTQGTATDADGNFSLTVSDNATLVISFLGYKSQEISNISDISENKNLIIRLLEDTKALEEVVVVGYGVQTKTTLTGSVSAMKGEE
ncbi:MAG: carboxypeptidase-like regulatory domain-containing protein, partial [Dysgonamonadaceae bacterium]|nr:carboxypeptidase-like regulatory domain-containing protein [Dysgonamonadaceae bacterium]